MNDAPQSTPAKDFVPMASHDDEELDRMFTYHAPKGDQQERYQNLRAKGIEMAKLIAASCPKSMEKSLAITQLRSAIQWANASIAIRE